MKKIVLLIGLVCLSCHLLSQNADSIITRLNRYSMEVNFAECKKGKSMIITHRALNKLIADKVGSYLSEGGDVSLFKNYATLSSSDGTFSLNRNLKKQPTGNNRIEWLPTLGFAANAKDGIASLLGEKGLSNDMSVKFRLTHLNRGKI